MRYSELGRTGIKVSRIGLGTMMYGSQVDAPDAFIQMDHAVERGVNLFDTAELYAVPPQPDTQGATETIIGDWLHARGGRDRIVLASKITGRSQIDWIRKAGAPTRITPAQIDEAVEGSLRRLRTDHIDLYQTHWPDRDVHRWGTLTHVEYERDFIGFAETLEHLGRHIDKGTIRAIGVSNETPWGVMRFLAAAESKGLPRIASIQNAYNLVNRTFELGLSEIAMEEQVGLIAYSVLGQGYLTGKYQGGARPPGSRGARWDRLQRYQKVRADEAIQSYLDLADARGIAPEALAVRFVDTRPFVTSTLVGGSTLAQLKADMDAFDLDWPDALEAEVDRLHNRQPNPCP
jgi:aryl-alcohol dehydrogenase-like predicted oxidoreductase